MIFMKIFKAYDIRGIVPDELNVEIARDIGKAFGTMRNGKVYVGSDARESSPEIKKAFIEGLVSTGCHVIDIGISTSPLIIFCAGNYNCPAVNITASHNPKKYNGMKFFDTGAIPLSYETGIAEIEKLFSSKKFKESEGSVEVFSPREEYTDHLLGNLKSTGIKMKVVVDCFNNAGSKINPIILKKLGLEVLKIRCNEDGNFPENGPNPTEENLSELKQKVVETQANLGIAFDGDADRLVIVDETGAVVETKNIFSLLVKNAAIDEKELKVVHDVLTSKTVDDVILEEKGQPLVCRVGHTYISQKALEEKAQLSGELSGHYYFKQTFYGDDALFATMKLLQYLTRKKMKITECITKIPKYFSKSLRITVNKNAKEIVENIKKELSEKYGNVDTLDGAKVSFDEGWMIFRASNTGPKISIAYESKSKEEFQKIETIVKEIVERVSK
jgi:phosphomannomutase / phosphoglucomutase